MRFSDRKSFPALSGGDGADTIIGSNQEDVLEGGGARDFLFGIFGADVLLGDFGAVGIGAGDLLPAFGDDVLVGGGLDDVSYGDAEILDLTLEAGTSLSLTTGDDAINSQIGSDPEIIDRNHGDAGTLSVALTGAGGGTVRITAGDDGILSGQAGESFGDAFRLAVTHDSQGGEVVVSLGNDRVLGGTLLVGDAAELSIGGTGAAAVTILAGDDLIYSRSDDALLVGDFRTIEVAEAGASATVFFGDDTLVSSGRDDRLAGDSDGAIPEGVTWVAGADTFVFIKDFGDDVVLDFDVGLDRLRFDGLTGAGFEDIVQRYDSGADALVLDLADVGGGSVTLLGVAEISDTDVGFT